MSLLQRPAPCIPAGQGQSRRGRHQGHRALSRQRGHHHGTDRQARPAVPGRPQRRCPCPGGGHRRLPQRRPAIRAVNRVRPRSQRTGRRQRLLQRRYRTPGARRRRRFHPLPVSARHRRDCLNTALSLPRTVTPPRLPTLATGHSSCSCTDGILTCPACWCQRAVWRNVVFGEEGWRG